MYSISILFPFSPPSTFDLSNREPKPPHTFSIFIHRTLTGLLWIFGSAEEHAFISLGFFVFANAAWLHVYTSVSHNDHHHQKEKQEGECRSIKEEGGREHSAWIGSVCTLTLAAASPGGLRSAAKLAAVGEAV